MGVVRLRGNPYAPIHLDAPHISKHPPTHLYPPYSPIHLYVSRGYLHMIWGWGIYTPHIFGALGASAHLSGILLSVSLSIVSKSVLLDWILLNVCYASCCCTFLCSIIMSQVSTTTAMTTTYLVTVVSSGMLSLSLITMAPSMMGLPATLGQRDVVLPPLLTPTFPGGVIGMASMPQQQPPSLMPL